LVGIRENQGRSSGLGPSAPGRLMTWRKIMVVETSAWPKKSWTVRMSLEFIKNVLRHGLADEQQPQAVEADQHGTAFMADDA